MPTYLSRGDTSTYGRIMGEVKQLQILKEMGCYEIQGYLYDKPLEKVEFEKRLVNKKYER